jgi:aminoglycoside 3-N-acetyltransferase
VKTHFNRSELREALSKLPLGRGDIIFSHSNLGFFGRPEGVFNSDQLCELFFEEIMAKLGDKGTLVVPTFTYSFPRKQVFDPLASPSSMGMFAEWVRSHPDSIRSEDPCYSVTAIGGDASCLVKKVPPNSFGEDSFFARFYRAGGKVLNLNFDAGSTFIHYVERKLDVQYRFDKTFEGLIFKNGENHSAVSTIWARYLSDDALAFDSKPFDKLTREKGLFRVASLGRGQLGLISAQDTYDCIYETLPQRPWLLTKAELLGVSYPIITHE